MRKSLLFTILVVAALVVLTAGPQLTAPRAAADTKPSPAPPPPIVLKPAARGTAPASPYTAAQVKRGRFLTNLGGCGDCHTPWGFDAKAGGPAPDMSRLLSGHPEGAPGPYGKYTPNDMGIIGPTFTSFAMPFGVVYAPNLTPDIDTGLGSWTEGMFTNAFRTGRHMGGNGRPILPPMSFLAVSGLPDEDIIAIFAYLRSVPPIRNGVETLNPPQEVQDAIDKANQEALKSVRGAANRP